VSTASGWQSPAHLNQPSVLKLQRHLTLSSTSGSPVSRENAVIIQSPTLTLGLKCWPADFHQ